VFHGQTVLELLKKQSTAAPQPPSERLGRPVSADLELLLLKCLAKSADQRPGSARELSELLDRCEVAGEWSAGDAEAWWDAFDRTGMAGVSISPTTSTANEATAIVAQTELQAS